jgi:hypothetical protein
VSEVHTPVLLGGSGWVGSRFGDLGVPFMSVCSSWVSLFWGACCTLMLELDGSSLWPMGAGLGWAVMGWEAAVLGASQVSLLFAGCGSPSVNGLCGIAGPGGSPG